MAEDRPLNCIIPAIHSPDLEQEMNEDMAGDECRTLLDPTAMTKEEVENERDLLRQIADERSWTPGEYERFLDLERGPGGVNEMPAQSAVSGGAP